MSIIIYADDCHFRLLSLRFHAFDIAVSPSSRYADADIISPAFSILLTSFIIFFPPASPFAIADAAIYSIRSACLPARRLPPIRRHAAFAITLFYSHFSISRHMPPADILSCFRLIFIIDLPLYAH